MVCQRHSGMDTTRIQGEEDPKRNVGYRKNSYLVIQERNRGTNIGFGAMRRF